MNGDVLLDIINQLGVIEKDDSVPKSVRTKIKNTLISLNDKKIKVNLRINRSLEELGDMAEDPTVPNDTKAQILTLVSLLESRE